MTRQEAYQLGIETLKEAGVPAEKVDAQLLLTEVCHIDKTALLVHGEEPLSAEEETRYHSFLQRRANRIPLQHILGKADFMGLEFVVNEHVLVPRWDTEILVEHALKELRDGMRILDLCTGSGCILCSLLHYSNGTTGVAADLSPDALRVAKENAKKLGLFDRIIWAEGDLFAPVDGKFDMIVSNPPYIPADVIPSLMPEVRDHDPYMALEGGKDGLDFYRRIAAQAWGYLENGGTVFLEIGAEQKEAVEKLLSGAGFKDVKTEKDYGDNPRVVMGRKPAI